MHVLSVKHSEKVELEVWSDHQSTEKASIFARSENLDASWDRFWSAAHALEHRITHPQRRFPCFWNRFWSHYILHWTLDDFSVISWFSEPRELRFHRGQTPIFAKKSFWCLALIFTEIGPPKAFVLRPKTNKNHVKMFKQWALHRLAGQGAFY